MLATVESTTAFRPTGGGLGADVLGIDLRSLGEGDAAALRADEVIE